jgi:myosin heavy subunit
VKPDVKNGNSFEVACAAKVLSADKDRYLVVDDEGHELWINKNQVLKAIHSTSNEIVDDMISMFELEEYTIVRNLYMRYQKKQIYVSVKLFFLIN